MMKTNTFVRPSSSFKPFFESAVIKPTLSTSRSSISSRTSSKKLGLLKLKNNAIAPIDASLKIDNVNMSNASVLRNSSECASVSSCESVSTGTLFLKELESSFHEYVRLSKNYRSPQVDEQTECGAHLIIFAHGLLGVYYTYIYAALP